MARKKTVPPSAASRADGKRVDAREWLGGIRFSGFTVIMLGLVVLGAFVLVPTLGTYLDQRQKIAALEESVQLTQDEIDQLEQQKKRWRDPAFITTEARERLYYVRPGEVVYIVDNDLEPSQLPAEPEPVSDEAEESGSDWMTRLLRSTVTAGLAQQGAAEYSVGVPDEQDSSDPEADQ